MIDYPVVRLRSLDKITARTRTFEAEVGSTVQFGALHVKIRACRKASPIDQPESAAFLQIWEIKGPEETLPSEQAAPTLDKAEWVFSGWMFASSPGLSPMDHPIYDVWVLDCLEKPGATPSVTPDSAEPSLQESPPETPATE
ncbi:MAG: DUF2155 domain-containing protein [Alphaproteobacteria bacterium]|nr:DUF2155 domain-containing protein [Alphaproteobacteria bacterium]